MEVTELARLDPGPLEEVVDRLAADADGAPPTRASLPGREDVAASSPRSIKACSVWSCTPSRFATAGAVIHSPPECPAPFGTVVTGRRDNATVMLPPEQEIVTRMHVLEKGNNQ